MEVKVKCDPRALPILAQQLRAFGARVEFQNGWSGIVASEAGEMFFRYADETLTVTVTKDQGHFARLLLIGGIKQTIEEANETIRRTNGRNPLIADNTIENANLSRYPGEGLNA